MSELLAGMIIIIVMAVCYTIYKIKRIPTDSLAQRIFAIDTDKVSQDAYERLVKEILEENS